MSASGRPRIAGRPAVAVVCCGVSELPHEPQLRRSRHRLQRAERGSRRGRDGAARRAAADTRSPVPRARRRARVRAGTRTPPEPRLAVVHDRPHHRLCGDRARAAAATRMGDRRSRARGSSGDEGRTPRPIQGGLRPSWPARRPRWFTLDVACGGRGSARFGGAAQKGGSHARGRDARKCTHPWNQGQDVRLVDHDRAGATAGRRRHRCGDHDRWTLQDAPGERVAHLPHAGGD